MYLDKVTRGVLTKLKPYTWGAAPDHGLPQIISGDPIVSSVGHAIVHPCAKYGLILTLLPMYLDKYGRGFFWPEPYIWSEILSTPPDHGLPHIIFVDNIVSSVGHAMLHPYAKYAWHHCN